MAIVVKGLTYYRTAEVCRMVGISRSTFFRWVRKGLFEDVTVTDRRGWRLFSESDVERLRAEAQRTGPNVSRVGNHVTETING